MFIRGREKEHKEKLTSMAIVSDAHYRNKEQLLDAHKKCCERLSRILKEDQHRLQQRLACHGRRIEMLDGELREYRKNKCE